MVDNVFSTPADNGDTNTGNTTDSNTSTVDLAALQEKLALVEKRLNDKDAFIETLKSENKQLRETRTEVDQIIGTDAERSSNAQDVSAGQDKSSKEITREKLREMFSEFSSEERERITTERNIQAVSETLQKMYGDRAAEIVALKASELGVSPDFLQSVAAKSPKAFYAQIGITEDLSRVTTASAHPAQSTVNTQVLDRRVTTQTTQPNTYKWYVEQAGGVTALANNQTLQRQMMADALKLREDFYK